MVFHWFLGVVRVEMVVFCWLFSVFWKAAIAQNYKKPKSFFRILAISHFVDEHHFFTDLGCQHEAQNPSKIQVLRLCWALWVHL